MIMKGNLDLSGSGIESLGKIEKVNGDLFLNYCQYIQTLGNLTRVEGIMDIDNSSLKSLGKLKYVGFGLRANNSSLKYIEDLEQIDGNLYLEANRVIESLGNLKIVNENLFLSFCSNLKDLGRLHEVKKGKVIYLNKTNVTREYIMREKPGLIWQCDWTT